MLDSAQIQGALRKAAAAIIGVVLSMVLLTALLITGFYLLVQASLIAMSPWLGEAGAMALAGFICLLLLAIVFQRLTRPVRRDRSKQKASGRSRSGIDVLRDLIRENPLEAALTAFAAGVVEQSDPRLKSLLLEGGMSLMKQAETERAETTADTDETSAHQDQSGGK
jgi:Kef-type K+ transport system membrane component KefB